MQKVRTTLYGEDKKGGLKQWSVYVDGPTFIVEWGKLDGKLQTKSTTCKAKNVGKISETSADQQAIKEAEAKWEKQRKSKFYCEDPADIAHARTEGVMLCQKFNEKGHLMPEECFVSSKLDGVRVKATTDDGLSFVSRGNDNYPILVEKMGVQIATIHDQFHIKQLDGEMYKHGVQLQNILSAVRVFNPEITPGLVYNIFDVPMLNVKCKERFALLDEIDKFITANKYTFVKVVRHFMGSKNQVDVYNHDYLQNGFEGVVFNDPEAYYEFQNHRSNGIQKFKTFKDSECFVKSVTCDKQGEGVLLCDWWNGKEKVQFELKMRGDHAYRSYENMLTIVGQWVTFKYQQLTADGNPQFAVGWYVRKCDEDGNPLE